MHCFRFNGPGPTTIWRILSRKTFANGPNAIQTTQEHREWYWNVLQSQKIQNMESRRRISLIFLRIDQILAMGVSKDSFIIHRKILIFRAQTSSRQLSSRKFWEEFICDRLVYVWNPLKMDKTIPWSKFGSGEISVARWRIWRNPPSNYWRILQ